MKKIIVSLLLFCLGILIAFSQTNPNHVKVKGYYRKDGTYVQPHYRTAPNSTNRDNFSTKPNYNPYTGESGYIQPDNKTKSTYSSYTYPSTSSGSYSTTYSKNSSKYSGKTNSSGQKVITYTNGEEVFGLCKYCNDIIYNEKNDYYWYTPHEGIQKTQGGSGGTLLDGEYKFYNENGKLLIKANYKKGIEHGDYIVWNEQGDIKEKFHYTNGEVDYMKFTNDDGYIIEWKGKMFHKGSIKNVYTYYGLLIETSTVIEDFKFQYKIYNELNGKLEMEFTKGIGDFYYDTYKTYYKNGNVKFIGYFTDNFRDGNWEWYDESGTLESVLKYRIYTDTYANGQLKVKGSQYYNTNTKQWIRDGQWIFFKENGTDWANIKQYEDGIEVHEKE